MLFPQRSLVILALCSGFYACGPKAERPSRSDEELARLMADLAVADAATNALSGFEKDSLAQLYYKQVFDKHGTNLETYEKDLRLIVNDFERIRKIQKRAEEFLAPDVKK